MGAAISLRISQILYLSADRLSIVHMHDSSECKGINFSRRMYQGLVWMTVVVVQLYEAACRNVCARAGDRCSV